MPNFRMVDLLPQDVILVDNGVKLSREFAQCPGACLKWYQNIMMGEQLLLSQQIVFCPM